MFVHICAYVKIQCISNMFSSLLFGRSCSAAAILSLWQSEEYKN